MTIQSDATELDVEQLMLRIRESAEKRKPADSHSRFQPWARAYPRLLGRSQSHLETDIPDLKLSPDFKPNKDNHYHVNDLLRFHDTHFVRNAYQAILKRDPDDQGFKGYLERLRSGDRNKIDILASLRFSAEGRQRKVRVDGLGLRATVRLISRVPFLGYFLQLLIGVLRIPASTRERRRFESYSLVRAQELADHLNRMVGIMRELRHLVSELPNRIAEQQELTSLLDQRQQELTALLDQRQRQLTALVTQQRQQLTELLEEQQQKLGLQEDKLLVHGDSLAELSESVRAQRMLGEDLNTRLLDDKQDLTAHSAEIHRLAQAVEHVRTQVTIQQARTTSLIKAIDQSPMATPQQSDTVRKEDSHMLDALYVSLEDHFRGDRSEIKKRLEVYLPYFEEAGITADILDVGCGRGEWIELLREKGVHARGVDANRSMVEQCQASGLKVTCENAIDHFRSLPDSALNAVTSFHVIEHLGFKQLVELIDEIVRTLRPGGLLVLETPNPENIIVGSCNFYFDPTHCHPLPIQTTSFLLEAKGFSDLKVIGLHTLESSRIQGKSELINRFNEFFYGPMDYAVLARRN